MKTSITAVEKAGWSTPLVIRGNLEQGIARAAQWGYDGIELHLTDSDAVDKKAVISALRANNISLTSIGTGPSYSQQGIFLTSPKPDMAHHAPDGLPLTSLSVELLSPHGRLVPLTFAPEPVPINFRLVNKNELVIAGTRNQNRKFKEVVESLPGRRDRIDCLVTHVFPVEEAKKAFETAMDKNSGACKVIITF